MRELTILPIGLSYARNRGLQASAVDDEGFGHCQFVGEKPRIFDRPSTPPWVVGTGGNMAFATAALRRQGGFDLTVGAGAHGRSAEDAEVIVSLLRSGWAAAWVPETIVYHPTKIEEERLASRYPYAFGVGRVARQRRDASLACRYALSQAAAIKALAEGRDPSWLSLRALLARAGVDSDALPAAVVSMLATWNAHERARRDVLSAAPAPHLYHELLVERAPALASQMRVHA